MLVYIKDFYFEFKGENYSEKDPVCQKWQWTAVFIERSYWSREGLQRVQRITATLAKQRGTISSPWVVTELWFCNIDPIAKRIDLDTHKLNKYLPQSGVHNQINLLMNEESLPHVILTWVRIFFI